LITTIAPFIDYGKLLTLPLERETKFEIGIQVELLNKIFIVTEFGNGALVPPDSYTNANYSSTGNYYRVGLGYKIDMNAKNNFGISGRFAQASFSDKGVVEITSASGLYDDFEAPFVRDELRATWYEIVLNSESKIFKNFYAGFFLRLRIMGNYDRQTPLDVYAIPGYGRTFDKSIPAFNFYLKYAFEFFERK